MEGELDEVVDALITHYQAEVLKATGSAEQNGKPGNRSE
jgi:protein subunit release factor A